MADSSRVLLVCPEPLGHAQPAGVGIRFLEFARALLEAGHQVTILSPDGGSVPGCVAALSSPQNLRDFSTSNHVAILQGHIVNDFLAHAARIPLVIDLYDPFIIENLHYVPSHGRETFDHDHSTLLKSLAAGDFFICASAAQRLFYLGLLLSLKRVTAERFHDDPTLRSLIDLVPFGVPPAVTRSTRFRGGAAVLFGGIYDWYDPILAIEAVRIARHDVPSLTLTFTRHPNPDLTPQGMTARTIEHVRSENLPFIHFENWTPYLERGAFYDRFACALLTFRQSLETELSMRTRVFDFLWAGLPVISSSAAGTDEVLLRYDAGVTIGSDRAEDFAAAIVSLMSDDTVRARFAEGGRRFTADHQWPMLMEPLLQFCRRPVQHAEGTVPSGAALGRFRKGMLTRLKKRIGGPV